MSTHHLTDYNCPSCARQGKPAWQVMGWPLTGPIPVVPDFSTCPHGAWWVAAAKRPPVITVEEARSRAK
jgi:hypothetical protein